MILVCSADIHRFVSIALSSRVGEYQQCIVGILQIVMKGLVADFSLSRGNMIARWCRRIWFVKASLFLLPMATELGEVTASS
jgi:hypothetical protein